MLAVALAALRARRASSLVLWLLAVLVTAVAVGAPYYLLAILDRTVTSDVAAAPTEQRLVELAETVPLHVTGAPPLSATVELMRRTIILPGTVAVEGMRTDGSLGGSNLAVATRDGVCGHVTVEGACPTATDDVMLSRTLATQLRLRVGDTVVWPGSTSAKHKPLLRVVGLYAPIDPDDPYWGTDLLAGSAGNSHTADAVFVTPATMVAVGDIVTVERQLLITAQTVREV